MFPVKVERTSRDIIIIFFLVTGERVDGVGGRRGLKGALAANTSWWWLLFRGVRASALAIGAR